MVQVQVAQMVAHNMLAGIDGYIGRNGASMQSPALYSCTRDEKMSRHQKCQVADDSSGATRLVVI